ncbi:MAG TPA: BT_3928 family protein [Chitinophagaceae bacterium]|nr:BT_3928 family protein [Chitinophagaceae bacterium]
MKAVIHSFRILVGLLFIFSGLVKANDPHGLSYKMQEFFEVWGIHGFNGWTLLMSVLMNAFEIIAGFALLLGWRIRLFSWLLLLLIVFFTFLTGYTFVTGKPTNCGCFGDCLPITSRTSFLKDVVLTIMIAFLFWQRKHIRPLFGEKTGTAAMMLVTIFSFGVQWYTLNYLPIVDCLPFKRGNNISEKMKMPTNAVPDSTVVTFVYKKEGKEVEFTADSFPEDFSKDKYEFVRRYDKVVRQGQNNQPAIKGFVLSGESNLDSTNYVLEQPYAILLFVEKIQESGNYWKENFGKIYRAARTKNIPAFVITASAGDKELLVKGTTFSDITVYKCDYKAIQTAARSNPCIYLLKKGTVMAKYSGEDMSKMLRLINDQPVIPAVSATTVETDTTSKNK